MHVYLTRMGVLSGAFADRQLCPLIDRACGGINGDVTTTDAQFVRF